MKNYKQKNLNVDKNIKIFKVNYMSAQMLATAGNLTGTTSDLAPTGIQDTNNSDMALLEQKATRQAQQKNKILFVT